MAPYTNLVSAIKDFLNNILHSHTIHMIDCKIGKIPGVFRFLSLKYKNENMTEHLMHDWDLIYNNIERVYFQVLSRWNVKHGYFFMSVHNQCSLDRLNSKTRKLQKPGEINNSGKDITEKKSNRAQFIEKTNTDENVDPKRHLIQTFAISFFNLFWKKI